MFHHVARTYITSLIHIQRKIKNGGYVRDDQRTLNDCLYNVETLLKTWKYDTNELMAKFWIRHREEIRYLIPTSNYKGFEALLAQYKYLDRDSKIYQSSTQFINS